MSRYEFFPKKPPGPVDDAYVQVRWVRAYRPSGPRWLLCGFLAVVEVVVLFVCLVVLLQTVGARDEILAALVAVAAGTALSLLILRLALTSVWVNDSAIRVISLTRYGTWRWSEVADVWFDADGDRRLLVVLVDGTQVATPVRPRGLDFVGRPLALDIAAESTQGWFALARRRRRPPPP